MASVFLLKIVDSYHYSPIEYTPKVWRQGIGLHVADGQRTGVVMVKVLQGADLDRNTSVPLSRSEVYWSATTFVFVPVRGPRTNSLLVNLYEMALDYLILLNYGIRVRTYTFSQLWPTRQEIVLQPPAVLPNPAFATRRSISLGVELV